MELESALEEMSRVLAQQCQSATERSAADKPELKVAAPAGFDWGDTF